MWGSIGDTVFKLAKTPENIEITQKAKYAKIAIFGQKEKLHFTGHETNTVKITFYLNNSFCSPMEELQKLQEIKQKGQAENLIIGDENFGKFVIDELKYSILKTTPNGIILSLSVEINLTEVNDDNITT